FATQPVSLIAAGLLTIDGDGPRFLKRLDFGFQFVELFFNLNKNQGAGTNRLCFWHWIRCPIQVFLSCIFRSLQNFVRAHFFISSVLFPFPGSKCCEHLHHFSLNRALRSVNVHDLALWSAPRKLADS